MSRHSGTLPEPPASLPLPDDDDMLREILLRLPPQPSSLPDDDDMLREILLRLPPQPSSLPDDDDMLREILLRLPPQPSSLPRASAVCRRWRGIVTDPKFLRCFYAHHRKPPLLGVFHFRDIFMFTSVLDPPDRIPARRFSLGRYIHNFVGIIADCRHGRVLIEGSKTNEVVVCDLITNKQHHVPIPPEFKKSTISAAVLCAASDQGHLVHGGCHWSPFKVILVNMCSENSRPIASVYSSETATWGNIISTESPPCKLYASYRPGSLVGNALYWLQSNTYDAMLAFDLDEQSLAVIKGPPITHHFNHNSGQIIQAENGAVGLAILSYPSLQLWQRDVNSHGVAIWVMWKTIEIHYILDLPFRIVGMTALLGYSEDTHTIFMHVAGSVYMVQLQSMQSKRIGVSHDIGNCYPLAMFYPPGDCSSFFIS